MSRPLIGSVLLASIAATLVLAGPVSAQGNDSAISEVRYGDLDLKNDADVARLHRRIDGAARQLCGDTDSRNLKMSLAISACRKAALTDAGPKVELAIANARSGHELAANAALQVGKPGNR